MPDKLQNTIVMSRRLPIFKGRILKTPSSPYMPMLLPSATVLVGALLVSQSWMALLTSDFAETALTLLVGTALMAGGILAFGGFVSRAGVQKHR